MQATIGANDDMDVKQKKEKTIDVVFAHGSMMLSLGHTHVPGLRNIEQKHYTKQTKLDGSKIMLKSPFPAF